MKGLVKGMEDKIVFEEIDVTRDRGAASSYGVKVQATPTLLILDAQGNQVKVFVGVPKENELRSAIEKALAP